MSVRFKLTDRPAHAIRPAPCLLWGGRANGYPFTGQARGTPYTHPDYNPQAFFLRDVGVVVLSASKELSQYGALPQLNQRDLLKNRRGQQDVGFTAVGYGMQASFPDAAAGKDQAFKIGSIATLPRSWQANHSLG